MNRPPATARGDKTTQFQTHSDTPRRVLWRLLPARFDFFDF
jgi:hypothetical protein